MPFCVFVGKAFVLVALRFFPWDRPKFLTFRLAKEDCGTEIRYVTKTIGIQRITEVPFSQGGLTKADQFSKLQFKKVHFPPFLAR